MIRTKPMNRHTAEKRRTIEARMAGLDDIISNNAFLRGIANAMGMQREIGRAHV